MTVSHVLGEPSLADAMAAIAADASVPQARKQYWQTSMRSLATAIGRPPESLPCRLTALRHPVNRLNAAAIGWSDKTLANHKSNLKAAIHHYIKQENVPVRGASLNADWVDVMQSIVAVRSRRLLSSLARFCSIRNFAPRSVTEDIVASCLAFREETTFHHGGIAYHRDVVKAWNDCVGHVPGFPNRILALPELPISSLGPAWEAFPEGLRKDIDAYLLMLSKVHRSPNGKRRQSCKPSTLTTRRRELVAFARSASHAGIATQTLGSLHSLLEPDVVTVTLESYLARNGKQPKNYTVDLAAKLLSVAKSTSAPASTIERLEEIRSELEQERGPKLTEKNLKVIRQVLQTDIWRQFIALPRALMARAGRMQKSRPNKAASLAALALQLEILIRAPLRIGNLMAIRLEENLKKIGPSYRLHFPGYDVKNRVDLDFTLAGTTAAMIDDFIRDYRPLFEGHRQNDFLFPGEGVKHRSAAHASASIAACVERETGLRLTAHQFRHAAAAIILKNEPGNYEFARRLLGHRNISTTQSFYAGLESFQAANVFGELIERELKTSSGKKFNSRAKRMISGVAHGM